MDLKEKKISGSLNERRRRIYGRNTVVKVVDNLTSQDFMTKNHRQGKAGDSIKKLSLGLFTKDQNELVGVIQFCSPRTSAKKKQYSNELLRLCFKKGVTIVGGASKLIKYYIDKYDPDDFFTYQDTTGENTDVYEKSGMTFVRKNSKKKYLVKDGLNLTSATFGKREIYSISEVVRRGPDALLGTKLGEQFDSKGVRKTNVDLFLDLGWHIEETSGDKIFEWTNPKRSYYTYKIGAKNSDKYYIGVHLIKMSEPSIEDCLNDGYWGSGGIKFQNWRNKYRENLFKEIIHIFDYKQDAYKNEKELVGNLWRTDPLCLNGQEGGQLDERNKAWNRPVISKKQCSSHGITKHIGSSCFKCSTKKKFSEKECLVHGPSQHIGDTCTRCLFEKSLSLKECPNHGETKHIGYSCLKCSSKAAFSKKECATHGVSIHIGDACSKCFAQKSMSHKECSIHGITKHKGDCCTKCKNQSVVSEKSCWVHGITKHEGNTCTRCSSEKQISIQICPIHGESKYRGDKCYKCSIGKSVVMKMCPTHGETVYQKDSCKKCVAQARISHEECPSHGLTKHQSGVCSKCVAQSKVSVKECRVHGLSKHRGNTCCKCINERSRNQKNCNIHGLTNHIGNVCRKCISQKSNHNRGKHSEVNSLCPICLETQESSV